MEPKTTDYAQLSFADWLNDQADDEPDGFEQTIQALEPEPKDDTILIHYIDD